MRVAVVGSRKYPNLQQVIDFVNSLPDGTTVVSGGAVGVDITAQRAAEARDLPVQVFLPRFMTEDTPYSASHYGARNSEIVRKAIRAKRRVQTFRPDETATWEIVLAHFAKAAS